ncbi:MAG: hypothetical protein HN742_26315 [Lentisphaerae bacterium]|jgi:hypothetical protein|nr:hypothetical protein [Lentisphaerota bacterium]MBT5606930.1 hypothetical protein [Lentisphaerota bacterium]MBT7845416.1 hypothetical protein [Lentisphaerota bacterium]
MNAPRLDRHGLTRPLARCAVLTVLAVAVVSHAQEENLLRNARFANKLNGWEASGNAARYSVMQEFGRGPVLRYAKRKDETPDENSHFDQVVQLVPGTLYTLLVQSRATPGLRPVIRVASMGWQTIATAMAADTPNWQTIHALFRAPEEGKIRVQIFGGAHGEIRQTFPGESFFDDLLLRPANTAERERFLSCAITISHDQPLHAVNRLFFGSNTLFMIDDDEALADGSIARHLSKMPCTLLRFPGGDVADNYLWKTHSLDNRKWWPSKQGSHTTDTDEFMALCRQVGAEPILVVNLEAWLLRGDVEGGARDAADWVRHCNVTNAYGVKYWEIGNETYLYSPGKHKRLPVSARQYAQAYLQFSAAMKAVDPTIRTGAIGHLHPNVRVSLGDHRDEDPWWPTIFDLAGDKIDFAVVHEYALSRFGVPLRKRDSVRTFREFLRKNQPDRHIPIALTEWNLNKKTEGTASEKALMLAERIGEYLLGGVDMATFWPLRIGGRTWGNRGLLSAEDNTPQMSHRILAAYATRLANGGTALTTTCEHQSLFCMAAEVANGPTYLFVCNSTPEESGLTCVIDAGQRTLEKGTVEIIGATEKTPATPPALTRGEDGRLQTVLPPKAFAILTLR